MSGGRPTFVLSLDEELVWGSFDHTPADVWAQRYRDPRGVVRELLALLDRHDMPATWAIVGHLFLGSCRRGPDGRAHAEMPRPRLAWRRRDWFADDPCADRATAPLWYGDDLVEAVLAARARHEVACHSFSHIPYGDPGCTAEAVAADLAACVDAARRFGVALKSFVFPRNLEGHHDLLRKNGFTAFRGLDPTWYGRLPRPVRRAAHLLDQAAAIAPPVVHPTERMPGLWNIPGSMLLLHRAGVRRAVPMRARVAKARAGVARAIACGGIFHLWFHPFNMAIDRPAMFGALHEILAHVADERSRGRLDVSTMADVAAAMIRGRGTRSTG